MRYPPHILEEIRARLPASAVVGRRVQLKKAGREWRGLSPFNAEKTPSFYVNDQKQFYHCFSSSKHGDIFTFLMETEGLSFPEAVERLASEAGVSLPAPTEDTRVAEKQRAGAIEVMDMAARWFEDR
ncbi:CHC2 zinc finger domain-containing protein, partial [Salmonella enterica]|uniref:CHC2 zinc finger domain-containing protein n=1 Tax=Salmonella enterica TaxID=28901 RepID=UPI003528F50E